MVFAISTASAAMPLQTCPTGMQVGNAFNDGSSHVGNFIIQGQIKGLVNPQKVYLWNVSTTTKPVGPGASCGYFIEGAKLNSIQRIDLWPTNKNQQAQIFPKHGVTCSPENPPGPYNQPNILQPSECPFKVQKY